MNTHPRRIPDEIRDLPPFITFCFAAAFLATAAMLVGAAFLAVTTWVWLVSVL